jgi:hypothetical protein
MFHLSGKPLEDAFFLLEDRKIIENLRILRKLEETKDALAETSGIRNDEILDKLIELEVRPETLASLCVAPLVEVAWADGAVDEKEKKAILAAAGKNGFEQGSFDYSFLEQWMTHKPKPQLLEAWTHYIKGLCEQLTPSEKSTLKSEIMGHAVSVAEASGGLLGLSIGDKISKAEREMLDTLDKAFM